MALLTQWYQMIGYPHERFQGGVGKNSSPDSGSSVEGPQSRDYSALCLKCHMYHYTKQTFSILTLAGSVMSC